MQTTTQITCGSCGELAGTPTGRFCGVCGDDLRPAGNTEQTWWVTNSTGTPVGPYSTDRVQQMLLSGRLGWSDAIRPNGVNGAWQAVGAYSSYFTQESSQTYAASHLGAPAYRPSPGAMPVPRRVAEPMSPEILTLLSVVTVGIFWLFWVFKQQRIYTRVAGRVGGSTEGLYWGMIATFGAATVLLVLFPPLGWVTFIACLVVQSLFLNSWLHDRNTIAARLGSVRMESKETIIALNILAGILSLTILGLLLSIPLMIAVFFMIYRSHDRLVKAATAAGIDWETH